MPEETVLYFGDQGHVPYGSRSIEQIQLFSEAITRFLLAQGAKIIVVACNTASAAALRYLREKFPDVPFVGMGPAVKPAAKHMQTGRVGVLANPATWSTPKRKSLLQSVGILRHEAVSCSNGKVSVPSGLLPPARNERILRLYNWNRGVP